MDRNPFLLMPMAISILVRQKNTEQHTVATGQQYSCNTSAQSGKKVITSARHMQAQRCRLQKVLFGILDLQIWSLEISFYTELKLLILERLRYKNCCLNKHTYLTNKCLNNKVHIFIAKCHNITHIFVYLTVQRKRVCTWLIEDTSVQRRWRVILSVSQGGQLLLVLFSAIVTLVATGCVVKFL